MLEIVILHEVTVR